MFTKDGVVSIQRELAFGKENDWNSPPNVLGNVKGQSPLSFYDKKTPIQAPLQRKRNVSLKYFSEVMCPAEEAPYLAKCKKKISLGEKACAI